MAHICHIITQTHHLISETHRIISGANLWDDSPHFCGGLKKHSMKKLPILLIFFLYYHSNINAQTWDSLGDGIGVRLFGHEVYAMAEYNGNLFAGGSFSIAGNTYTNNIGQWNGATWDSAGTNDMQEIVALCNYDTELYAANLSSSSPILQRWNGNDWAAIPGLPSFSMPQFLEALLVYNGKLYVGGGYSQINNISSWNNSTWDSLMNGTNGPVYSLTEFNGSLYAGGSFDSAGRIRANNIAVWNGTVWSNVGKGINGSVLSIAVFNNNLYVGGTFDSAGGLPAKNIAVWNGSNWNSVGSGVNNSVYALAVYGSVLIAGGIFDTAGGLLCNKIAQWNGTNWNVLGTGVAGGVPSAVFSLSNYMGSLIVGGSFTYAGGIPVNNIAQWRSPLSINTINGKIGEVIAFPNPSTGIFKLVSAQNPLPSTIEIYNVLGEKVLTEIRQLADDNLIDLTGQPNGIYLYRVLKENGELIGEGKLIVQK